MERERQNFFSFWTNVWDGQTEGQMDGGTEERMDGRTKKVTYWRVSPKKLATKSFVQGF